MAATLAVIAIRLIVPLAILGSPFWGMLAAIAADTWDMRLADFFGWEDYHGMTYQLLDKLFDLSYLSIAWYVSRRWADGLARGTASVLFIWRAIGIGMFEITRERWLFLLFPNVFETFYLLIAGIYFFRPEFRTRSGWRLAALLAAAAIPKIIHEYFLHYAVRWG